MLYCGKCRVICEDSLEKCPGCRNNRLRPAEDEDLVRLHGADLYTAQKLKERLESQGLECRLEDLEKGGISRFYDSEAMPTDQAVYVRYKDLSKAREISVRLRDELARKEEKAEEEFEDMPPKKRLLVQALSIIAFLVLVMLAVLGADAAANWLKGILYGA